MITRQAPHVKPQPQPAQHRAHSRLRKLLIKRTGSWDGNAALWLITYDGPNPTGAGAMQADRRITRHNHADIYRPAR